MNRIVILAIIAIVAAVGLFYFGGKGTKTIDDVSDYGVMHTPTDKAPYATDESSLMPVPEEGFEEETVLATPAEELEISAEMPITSPVLYQHVYGDKNAPVTIIEYASLSCGHCGKFHTDVLPKLKEQVLDAGKAKLIYKDYPLNAPALQAAKLTQCVDRNRYASLLNTLYSNQTGWIGKQNTLEILAQYGQLVGLNRIAFDECQNNEEIENALLGQIQEAQEKYDIQSTPNFVFLYNGKVRKLAGVQPIDTFLRIIEEIQK